MRTTILVDKEHPIKENYFKKTQFMDAKTHDGKQILIETNTYNNYRIMEKFLKNKGIDICITKGHEIPHNGEFIDEIDTGMVLEVMSSEDISKYLKDYGFIKRGRKRIRYVGKFIANKLSETNLTLEEYLENYSEIVVVNKEPNMTSFDVVNDISHIFGIRRVGHTGTLDPMAEGVLIVAVGKATKIVELLTAEEKEYIAGVKLGIRTDTRDIEGKILEIKDVPKNLPIEKVLNSYKKSYMQEVPIYSAVKVDGKKLYDYARNDKEVELPKKKVTIKEIELLEQKKDTFKFRTLVSKGTYIRSLIDDIGQDLGTGATMTSLLRTKQGKITIDEASTLEEIANCNYKPHSIEEILEYPRVNVDDKLLFKIKNGQRVENTWNIKDKIIFLYKSKLIGIYEADGKELKVWKNF